MSLKQLLLLIHLELLSGGNHAVALLKLFFSLILFHFLFLLLALISNIHFVAVIVVLIVVWICQEELVAALDS